jgi:prepilin-type N-terminal cleavage/methylation domain-containing protein
MHMSNRHRSEDGFTLVELLVVMVLFGVIGGIVTTAIVSGMNSARSTSARTHALHDIEVALQRVGRDLRVADPLYLTGDTNYGTEIGAEVVRDGQVQIGRFAVELGDDGVQRLLHDVTTFDLQTFVEDPENATPVQQPTRTLVTAIDNGTEPVFRYFDQDGAEIVCTPGVDGETKQSCDGRYAAASQVSIRLIRLVDGQEPIRAETRISLRNTRYGGSGT